MGETTTERFERILDDILVNDAEIKGGAEAAGLDLENLREVVMRRKDDIWEEYLEEQNWVTGLEGELSWLEKTSLSRKANVKRYAVVGYVTFCSLLVASVILLVVFPAGRAGALSLAALAVGGLFGSWLLPRNANKLYRQVDDKQRDDLQARLDAANERLEQALREKGIRGTLR